MTPLTKEDLIQELARGCKPPEDFRIGTEHECFVLLPTHQRASYEGHRQSIRGIFESLKSFGWQPQQEKGYVIGMYHPQTPYHLEKRKVKYHNDRGLYLAI